MKAIAGFSAIVVVLAVGMVLTISRMFAVANQETARLASENREIAVAERLRWSGELIVSAGRGYILSGDRQLLAEVDAASADLTREIEALRASSLPTPGGELVARVEQLAGQFQTRQNALFAAKHQGVPTEVLSQRAERELLPVRSALGAALDQLVAYEEQSVRTVYARDQRVRQALRASTYAMLGVLVFTCLGLGLALARRLARAYQHERDATAQANDALAARDEVLGVVAHDLRNPLGAISLKAELVRASPGSERAAGHAASIVKTTHRMQYLINTMLAVVQQQAGAFAIEPGPCPVESFVREALDVYTDVAASKHVELASAITPPDLVVRADRERVIQVLANLLGNALRYTPPRGRVVISGRVEDGMARIAVTDGGPGIAPADLPHVFERLWKRTMAGHEGMGLGLHIAKQIVEAHGGRIWAESPPGEGATFAFTLPLAN